MKYTDSLDHETAPRVTLVGVLIQLLLILALLAAAFWGYRYFSGKKVRPRRKPPARLAPLVRVQPLKPENTRIVVHAMGTVIPAREMVVKAEVSGKVTGLNPQFAPGGRLQAGEEILSIDTADYGIRLTQAKGALAQAEHALKLEMGQQAVARRDWALVNGKSPAAGLDRELALRESHLANAKAQVEAAQAALQKARLDISRAKLKAPFNVIVKNRNIDVGSQVSTQENLGTLVGTDTYWIELSLPVRALDRFSIPSKDETSQATAVTVTAHGETFSGHVVRLLPGLTPQGRMARLLVAVPDPLGFKQKTPAPQPLLLGEYVRAGIQGKMLEDVFRIPRPALHDNDTLWLATGAGQLEIRAVTPIWQDETGVLVKENLQAGERLIVSALAGAISGMPLKVEKTATARPASKDGN